MNRRPAHIEGYPEFVIDILCGNAQCRRLFALGAMIYLRPAKTCHLRLPFHMDSGTILE